MNVWRYSYKREQELKAQYIIFKLFEWKRFLGCNCAPYLNVADFVLNLRNATLPSTVFQNVGFARHSIMSKHRPTNICTTFPFAFLSFPPVFDLLF